MDGVSRSEAVESIRRQIAIFNRGDQGDMAGALEDVYEYLQNYYPLDFPEEE